MKINPSTDKRFRRLKKGEIRRKTDLMAGSYINGKWGWFDKFNPKTHNCIQGKMDTWPTFRRRKLK